MFHRRSPRYVRQVCGLQPDLAGAQLQARPADGARPGRDDRPDRPGPVRGAGRRRTGPGRREAARGGLAGAAGLQTVRRRAADEGRGRGRRDGGSLGGGR